MLAIIAFWAGLACGAIALIRCVCRTTVQPPEVIGSTMSSDWMKHMIYQTAKPGGASDQYGCDGD